jgi:DNA polymerase/3'-5' exonuclease PolX
MSTAENKIPLAIARNVANRFIKYLEPYVKVISVAGSVRREVEYCGDVEVCAIPLDEFAMARAFPFGFKGLTINGDRLKRFIYPESGIQIELYLPQSFDYGRILAIRTGSSGYAHLQLMTQANRLGWIGTSDGLRRKKECEKRGSVWKILPEYKLNPTKPPEFPTEESFFEFIQIPWIHPRERSWVAQQNAYNYSK